ncbi:MAG: hypothetical protein E7620_09290 [Ruminococcaceae bacterium]|nr:hypothetical protein [Oscillospiraceae bacterium]
MIGNEKKAWAVRLAYLLTPLSSVILLLLAALPRFFFQMEGEIYEDLSLLGLMSNTFENCKGFLNGTANGSTNDLYFSYIMMAILAVTVAAMVIYAVFALFTALLIPFVWTPNTAGDPTVNNLKRAYRVFVFNKGFYVVYNLLPLIPALFPYLFQLFYRSRLGMKTTLHFYGLPDLIPTALLCLACCGAFLATLKLQKLNRMDLFRIYKQES